MAVGSVGGVEGLEVELRHRVDHEPGEVVVVEPVAQVRRQEHRLVAVAAEEVLGHAWMVQNRPDSRGFMRQPRVKAEATQGIPGAKLRAVTVSPGTLTSM